MTALTMPARRPRTPACGRCRGGGWPGSPGGSTASRWSAWPCCSAGWRVYLWLAGSYSCTTPTPPRPPAIRQAHSPARTWSSPSTASDDFLSNGIILQVLPVLIGAFVGAPVLARELETGTFRYAWTQGFGRWRWTLAKLVPLAAGGDGRRRLFSLLLSWYYQPYFATGNRPLAVPSDPVQPGLFDLRGVAFAAWTLAAFAIGALAGHAHPPGRPRDRRHPGRLRRARLRDRACSCASTT